MDKTFDNSILSKAGPRTMMEAAALFLTFLLPLKFGSLAAIPEATLMYPDNIFVWLLVTWPPALFCVVAAGFLGLTYLFYGTPEFRSRSASACALLWTLLALTAAVGYVNASCRTYPAYQSAHFFGLAAFALAVWRMIDARPESRGKFFAAVAAGVLVSAVEGVYQYAAGFEETRKYAYSQELASGVSFVREGFHTRLYENRVFAGFSLCNSLAAHLILVVPATLWMLWEFCGRVTPPKVSRALFVPPVAILLLGVLFLTGSRAAAGCLLGAFMLTALIFPYDRRLRFSLLGVLLLALACGVTYICLSERGLKSLMFRFDYFWGALRMFFESPVLGTGWGDFFHEFMKIKLVEADEAPHCPHNTLLSFASQTGASGLVVSFLVLFYPLWRGWRSIRADFAEQKPFSMRLAVFTGLAAWVFHSLADVNMQVAGTMATAALMGIALCSFEEGDRNPGAAAFLTTQKFMWHLAVILVVGFCAFSGVRTLNEDIVCTKFSNLCDFRFKTREEFMAVSPDQVARELKASSEACPANPFLWATAADFMAMRGRLPVAEQYYKEAVRRSPERPSFYFRLGELQLSQGRLIDGLANMQKARAMFPNNPKYKKAEAPLGPAHQN